MERNDFVCETDLRVCGRGCEANPHSCPCLLRKETREHGHIVRYNGDGKAAVLIPTRQDRNYNQDKE